MQTSFLHLFYLRGLLCMLQIPIDFSLNRAAIPAQISKL
ncbi:hypothetical protein NC99_22320 [Sunxiuqinia dokdonensis]|uniref:Uncharacterized protein n=1 Tax=Sunxiuqinia dokdonensis TaxID=1409788 RepID=A0A0L8V8V7_9BACT|nr:hypothetical protein NC99_22320 [Sunxiuqinia dokdonensis]